MLLIYPPVSRSAEPPLGIARLAGYLRSMGLEATCLDLCQEGQEYLLGLAAPRDAAALAPFERGALKRRGRDLELLRGGEAFASIDRYRRVVLDLNRAMKTLSSPSGAEASLADYRDDRLSPLRRADLIEAAATYERNVFFPLFSRRIEEEIAATRPAALGLSICFLSQALCAFAIAGYAKKAHPELPIVIGGGLVSSWVAQGSLAAGDRFGGLVDAIIPGRGEDGILDCLCHAGATVLAGAGAIGEGRARRSASPDFSSFRSLSYLSPSKVLPYNFSWGCPWRRCAFCPETAERSAYSAVRSDDAMREIEELASREEPGLLHFTDNEVAPLYLRALAGKPPGARWYGFARFTGLLADPGFCRALAASGCSLLQLGLESGDQAVLDALDKGTRLEGIDLALENLAEAGIATYIYLLFGTPAEDRDAALRTRDYVASRASLIGFLNVAVFNLPAASEEAGRLATRPFYEGELGLYKEFSHPAGWDRPAVRSFLARDFGAEPAIGAILARTPPVFTSSHAAFFTPPRLAPCR